MEKKVFTKFSRHSNDIKEVIDANDINKIQHSVNNAEINLINEQIETFNNNALFAFDNNLYVNSIFIDTYNDKSLLDLSKCENIKFTEGKGFITLDDKTKSGTLTTRLITSTLDPSVPLNDFFLYSECHLPIGSHITHFIENEKGDRFRIANDSSDPVSLVTPFKEIRVVTSIQPNFKNETPTVKGLALMFYDVAVESQYGLDNPDLSRLTQSYFGTTILVRDKALQDKLVKIIEPHSLTTLTYSMEDDRLTIVETDNEKAGVTTVDKLNYGDYENSQGDTENVLLSISTEEIVEEMK